MAYYAFEKEWTNKSRTLIKEYDEIERTRVRLRERASDDDHSKTMNGKSEISIHSLDTIGSLVSRLNEEMTDLTDSLHLNNIYMNETIVSMISKYESILADELKTFSESITALYSIIREAKMDYRQVLIEKIMQTVNNPRRVIPPEITNHFKDGQVL